MEINNNPIESVPVPAPVSQVLKKPMPKKQVWILVALLVLLILAAIIGGYFYFKNNLKKRVNSVGQKQDTQKSALILPTDFPKDYIPLAYNKLEGIYNYPPKDSKPYALSLTVNRLLPDAYTSAKQYYADKGWQIAEVKDSETKQLQNIFTASSGGISAYLTFNAVGASTTTSTLVTLTIIPNKK